ncbi:hypothetical protein AHMF7605_02930 [Adhaeribacter arboris]|uniref:Ig-like domain-containing protein n=1 Tax=Adhaeribacter arboris TaxID=2072846 RepID=A0A2T2YAL3_9BACT|nr:hypothetical protein [Adhaeribacter arboris]PSR52552.1 hypothetical protein AHMF7605_02930 [Adhaeribacter arboris]
MYPLKLAIPKPGNYRVRVSYAEDATIFRSNVNVKGNPFSIPNVIALNGASFEDDTLTTAYYYLYNQQVKALNCPSERVAVVAQLISTIQATVRATGSATICPGDKVILAANFPAGVSFQWQKDDVLIPGATQLTYPATQSGKYSLAVFTGECVLPSTNSIQVTVNALTKPSISVLDTTLLTSSNTSKNQWFLDGVAISGATSATWVAKKAGNYSVMVTNNNCSVVSELVYVFVEEPPIIQNLTLYPNPAISNYIII